MQIYINGEPRETTCQNLLQLIQDLSLEGKRFAVEMNEMIISNDSVCIEFMSGILNIRLFLFFLYF